LEITKQLNAISLGEKAPTMSISLEPEKPSLIRIAATLLWFFSLILSVGSALYGLLVKQWIREYMRWTSIFPVQHAVHIRYHRKKNLDAWYIEWIVMLLSSGLTLGLVLFLLGIVVLLFDVNLAIAIVIAITVVFLLIEGVCVAILPIFVPSCPYRSALTSLLLIQKLFALKILDILRTRVPLIPKLPDTTSALLRNPYGAFKFQKEDLWAKQDMILNLPSKPNESVRQKWKTLDELINQQPIPDDIVAQCFSDLPGPPPPSMVSEYKDKDPKEFNKIMIEGGWRPDPESEVDILEWQFRYQCQILLSVFEKPALDHLSLPVDNRTRHIDANYEIQKLFKRLWTKSENSNGWPSFDINTALIGSFHTEIQRLNPSVKNAVLSRVSSLTISALNQHMFFSKIKSEIFMNLLGLHFILVSSAEPEQSGGKNNLFDVYYRTLVDIISTDPSSTTGLSSDADRGMRPSGRRPISYEGFEDYKVCIAFATRLLSFSILPPSTNSGQPPLPTIVTWKLDRGSCFLFRS
jgi:hypothetical protein